MKEQFRFMNELFRIVNGALRLDTDKVRNYTAFLADKLEEEGDAASANRLRKMLAESDHQLKPADASFRSAVPVDAESRFPLIERVALKNMKESPVVLSEAQWDTVREFLSIAKSHAQLEAQDGAGSMSLLMYGPPGTGKSHLARYIAREHVEEHSCAI
jgi:DNA replication protein DnaC